MRGCSPEHPSVPWLWKTFAGEQPQLQPLKPQRKTSPLLQNASPAVQLKLPAVPPLPQTQCPVRWEMPPPVAPLWGAQWLRPPLSSCLALAWGSRGKQLSRASIRGHLHRSQSSFPILAGAQEQLPFSPRSPGAAAPAPSVSGEVPPRQRPGCQIPAKSTFLRHDTSGAPAGDGTRSRRSPQRLRYRRGRGVRGQLAQRRLPRRFPLSARGRARQILQNILLPLPQAAGCSATPLRRPALPTPSIPFLPPRSFSRQLLTQAAFEGAPGQVAESDGARDESAAGKVGRRRELRAGRLTEHWRAAFASGWREQKSEEQRLLGHPGVQSSPLAPTNPPAMAELGRQPPPRFALPERLISWCFPKAEQGTGTCQPAGDAWARRAPRQSLRAGLRCYLPARSVLWLCLCC